MSRAKGRAAKTQQSKMWFYMGITVFPELDHNSNGLRWWAFVNDSRVRSGTKEGMKELIREYLSPIVLNDGVPATERDKEKIEAHQVFHVRDNHPKAAYLIVTEFSRCNACVMCFIPAVDKELKTNPGHMVGVYGVSGVKECDARLLNEVVV